MAIQYHELKPIESEIEIDSIKFKLRPFDLSAQVWAYNHFATAENTDGISVLSERIQDIKDVGAVIDVVWHLLKNKYHFNNSQKIFNKTIDNQQYKYTKTMEFRAAIVQCLGVSQPMIDEMKGELELKKSSAAVN